MRWWVESNRLVAADLEKHPEQGYITFNQFEHLTSKNINWKTRENTYVNTMRSKGHLKIYDEKFVINETYKHNYKSYKCNHVDWTGTALLTPTQGTALKAVSSNDANEWEIV